jgi:hypothetical membrane protein
MTAITAPASVTTVERTKALLACGVVAGPLFVTTVVIQELTRAGFDPKKHPLSLLSLGELGWLQITNFILCGLLAFASAFGIRRALGAGRASKWGPILFGVYGIGLVWGGAFVADPAFGYPAGAPEPATMSWHGILHGIAPAAAAVALIAAAILFARRYAAEGRRPWAVASILIAVADLALTGATFALGDYRFMLAGGVAIWLWAAAVTYDLLRRA